MSILYDKSNINQEIKKELNKYLIKNVNNIIVDYLDIDNLDIIIPINRQDELHYFYNNSYPTYKFIITSKYIKIYSYCKYTKQIDMSYKFNTSLFEFPTGISKIIIFGRFCSLFEDIIYGNNEEEAINIYNYENTIYIDTYCNNYEIVEKIKMK